MYNSYAHWKYNTDIDESMAGEDSFSGELSFGTSGIRGVIGIGPKRMNEYVVARACKGIAMQLISDGEKSVAITYDSRKNSDLFARVAAEVFAANKIKVYITKQLAPTPVLAYAIGQLGCGGGVVITASHNPKEYNGLKVYDKTGCQISGGYAAKIAATIKSLDYFNINKADFDTESASGNIQYMPQNIFDGYLNEVKKQGFNNCSGVKVCYTPLNGSGGFYVPALLSEKGARVFSVKEQAYPDGNFTTCPYPNPEVKEAFISAEKYAAESGCDIIIANDPDADRIGAMYSDREKYVLLSGDEIGLIICEYLLRQKSKVKDISGGIIVRSVVTMRLIDKIANSYGVQVKESLTGFKNICQEAVRLNNEGRGEDYIAGYEESNGITVGSYVFDKDGICAAMLLCEIAAELKLQDKNYNDRLEEIYDKYGIMKSRQIRMDTGGERQTEIMDKLRNADKFPLKLLSKKDYLSDENMKQNLLIFDFENCALAVRPSGTEPLIKFYLQASGAGFEGCFEKMEEFIKSVIK